MHFGMKNSEMDKKIWVYHIVSVTLYVCNCTPVRVYYEMCWHGDKFQPSTHVIILVKTSNIVPIAYNGNVILGIYFQRNYGYIYIYISLDKRSK